ncbi:MAG: hypothetical protein NTU91_13365 [Chloroflexi bacterium]|nr:hypothetical protein [Chloroflexota bacterium]
MEIIELEGEPRAVAIPEEGATAEDWRRAWMKVRKLRDTCSSAGVSRARLARAKRSGLTWPRLVDTVNSSYMARVYLAVKTGDPQAKYALAWLEYFGIKRDADQVDADLAEVAKIIGDGKWHRDVRLFDPPVTEQNIRDAIKRILEDIDGYMEGVDKKG